MPSNRLSRRSRSSLLVVVASFLLTVSAAADERRMEEIAVGWIEAHNSGDVATMAAYRAAHRKGAKDGWEDQFREMVERLGRLEPTGVRVTDELELTLGVESENAGPLRLVFRFRPDDPEQVASISIDSGGPPNDLPPLRLEGERPAHVAAIDEYLSGLAADDLFAGAVLIAEGEEVWFERAYGMASREFSVPNTVDTRFDIGSITKDFTRVAIAQLAAAGRLAPGDTVGEHLPDYPNARVRDEVTIEQLFAHRSGLGDYFTEEWRATPMDTLRQHTDYIEIWGPKELEYEPGSRSRYSNFGFTVLGAIIDRASGQPYFDYVAEKIFAPAGMTASGFFPTDEIVPDVAVGYTYYDRNEELGETLRKNTFLEPVVGGPWGKTYSTVRDLWRFWRALAAHRLTPAAYTPWVLLSGPVRAGEREPAKSEPIAEMALGGGGPGLSSDLRVSGERVIVILANLDFPIAQQVAERLAEALDGAVE